VTKSELVGEQLSGALQHRLYQLNSRAPIWLVSHGEIDPQMIFADEEALTSLPPRSASVDDAMTPGHAERIATIALEFPRPLPYAGLREWLGGSGWRTWRPAASGQGDRRGPWTGSTDRRERGATPVSSAATTLSLAGRPC
jgi:G3E family GTPase